MELQGAQVLQRVGHGAAVNPERSDRGLVNGDFGSGSFGPLLLDDRDDLKGGAAGGRPAGIGPTYL
jgi:hypothetical protein